MSRKRLGSKEPYARIYASAADHPSHEEAGLEATGLWARALAYSAKHLSDGFVPASWLERLGRKPLKACLAVGLIEKLDNGYLVHDYLDHNRSRAQVEAWRAKERGKKAGNTPGIPPGNDEGNTPGTPGGTVASKNGDSPGDPSRGSYSVRKVKGVRGPT